MALGSNGYRAAPAKHPLTPVRISSLRGTVGSQSFTFSTNFRQSRVAGYEWNASSQKGRVTRSHGMRQITQSDEWNWLLP
jgi:hypothetical protein